MLQRLFKIQPKKVLESHRIDGCVTPSTRYNMFLLRLSTHERLLKAGPIEG